MNIRALCLIIVLLTAAGGLHAADISNESIPFSTTVKSPDEIRSRIAEAVKALTPTATKAGIKIIHLQSVFYRLAPQGEGFSVEGSLSVDVLPAAKTNDFVDLLNKNGQKATISYFVACVPRASR